MVATKEIQIVKSGVGTTVKIHVSPEGKVAWTDNYALVSWASAARVSGFDTVFRPGSYCHVDVIWKG